tara:strand:+ start:1159 stop:1410 length:252 start_codon:yes stop_codon:yes gene_type:complete
MDLTKIGLYVLAGYGAYSLYDRYMGAGKEEEAAASFAGTAWQRKGYGGTRWQDYSNLVGTNWQQKGYNNACGDGYNNACGSCG